MKNIKSIYYHNPKPEGFEKMIVWLKKKGYRFVSDAELYEILSRKGKNREKVVFVSFDDAWKSNLSLIPIINKYNVPVTIFVPIEPLNTGNFWWEYVDGSDDRFKHLPYEIFMREISSLKKKKSLKRSCMTVEDVKEISKNPLVSIQGHTVNHPILTMTSESQLIHELLDGKKRLEEIIGKEVLFFSYPNGSYSEREKARVQGYYKMAVTVKMRHISPLSDDIYELPRICMTGNFITDKIKFYGIWLFLRKVLYTITRKARFKPVMEAY